MNANLFGSGRLNQIAFVIRLFSFQPRFLEFNGIVNKCLRKNPSTRQKELYIRTYAVIPLSEKAGLVEWIPNLTALRQIILKLHRETGTGLSNQETGSHVVAWNKAPPDR